MTSAFYEPAYLVPAVIECTLAYVRVSLVQIFRPKCEMLTLTSAFYEPAYLVPAVIDRAFADRGIEFAAEFFK